MFYSNLSIDLLPQYLMGIDYEPSMAIGEVGLCDLRHISSTIGKGMQIAAAPLVVINHWVT